METPEQAPSREAGFTLIELLVATALMVILTGSVTFIFLQAQQIFVTVDAKVQVYQYARYAFDQMERDLANVVSTRNMEFFNDRQAVSNRRNYDEGEEIVVRETANRDGDPDGDQQYNYAFTLRQPDPYEDDKGVLHRRDSVYFKTVTVSGGETSATLVEFALTDTDRERPKMVKRTWRVTGVDSSNPLTKRYEVNGTPTGLKVEQDLCLYCTDAIFEIFVKNKRRSDAGDYYECKQLTMPDPNDAQSGPPMAPNGQRRVFEPIKDYWASSHRMVQCYYDVDHDDGKMGPDFGLLEKDANGQFTLFRTEGNFTFPMLKEGDAIFIEAGGPAQIKLERSYKIKAFVQPGSPKPLPWDVNAPASQLRIQFAEPVEVPKNTASPAQVRFRAAFVPPAIRVTLRIKDAKSRQLRSVARVFKILAD